MKTDKHRSEKRGLSTVTVRVCFFAATTILAVPYAHALKDDSDQPINIRARSVEANEKTGVSVYEGNVVMTQGSLTIEADRLEVIARNRQMELVRATGNPLRMHARTDAGEDVRVRATRAEYQSKARKIDFFGNVELRRDGDVFTGEVVHYWLDDETFTAEGGDSGQVSATLQPAKKEPAR